MEIREDLAGQKCVQGEFRESARRMELELELKLELELE